MNLIMQEIHLQGTPICRGISIGKPIHFVHFEKAIPEFSVADEAIEDEIARYRNAISYSRNELENLQKRLAHEQIHEGATILGAQIQMLDDPLLTTHIEDAINSCKLNAEAVFHSFIQQYQKKFSSMKDVYFQDRFADIQDISRHVLGYLSSTYRPFLTNIPAGSIVFSQELSAADAATANSTYISAFVTERGGAASHAAIVAKAKGIPYVSNISLEGIDLSQHKLAIVDGRTGVVILSPSFETLRMYQHARNQLQQHMEKIFEAKTLGIETFDGYPIHLSSNIEVASELDAMHKHGGSGVGLFRSEYICFAHARFPSEDEQFDIYHDLVQKMKGLPIVIRTFDLGGDKLFLHVNTENEKNPFLGCRAIRFLLKEKEIFKTQLRAILRASAFGEVSIMFPMISTLCELVEAKGVIKEAEAELDMKGQKYSKVRIGCMIEVPSAAIIADLIAKECDFLSIGTNDLVQYALAVDRSNHAMSSLYSPAHPSVLRLIKLVVQEANHQGIPVSICGEVASDPRFTALLLGLGVHELSIATRFLPTVKHAIRTTSIVEASQLAEKALALTTADEIQQLLDREYKKNAPDDIYYNY